MSIIKKIVRFMSKFFHVFPVNRNKIFFMSFNGTKYGFDSKAIVEYIEKEYHGQFDLIWGVSQYDGFRDVKKDNLRFIKIKSIRGMYEMMTAGTLIYDINPPSYLSYRKTQLLINTWHGISYKKVGKYIGGFNKEQENLTKYFLSHASKYSDWVIRDSLEYENEILNCGLPRNDIFFDYKAMQKASDSVKNYFHINPNAKIALYAPTFRGDFNIKRNELDFDVLLDALRTRFQGEWVVIYRLHPMISGKFKDIVNGSIDGSLYPDMQELLCSTDFFITDYSGCLWDYSLTKRPALIYAPDADDYKKTRGLYMDCSELPFPLAMTNDEVRSEILSFDLDGYSHRLLDYFDFMGSYERGTARKDVMSLIKQWHNII